MRAKQDIPYWKGMHYAYFQNAECEYFPCHKVADPSKFNCLFCYCPLYMLGPDCGGNFRYNDKGYKDCTACAIPHLPDNYGRITAKYREIADRMRLSTVGSAHAGLPGDPPKDGHRGHKAGLADAHAGLPGNSFRIVMMACTERGFATMRRAAQGLSACGSSMLSSRLQEEAGPGPQAEIRSGLQMEIIQDGRCAHVPGFEDGPRLSALTKKWFHRADALVFFAATGIAVRCIAPFVQDKFADPAVIVVDENGRHAISLLSGHAGGANRLCGRLAAILGAQPVITTATDGRGLFAVDVFAADHGLCLSDRMRAKQVSARLLAGENISAFIDDEIAGADFRPLLQGYGEGIEVAAHREDADILLSHQSMPGDRKDALYLIPRIVTLGIGCRRGAACGQIERTVELVLGDAPKGHIFRASLRGIASIDLKKDEPGLHAFAEKWNLPLTFFSAEELRAVQGDFTASDFVRGITGVDNVCERAALLLAGEGGRVLRKKMRGNATTAALGIMPAEMQ